MNRFTMHIKRKTLPCTLLLLHIVLHTTLSAQNDTGPNKWSYTLSYFGNNAWNPGLQLSGEKVLFVKEKIRSNRPNTILKQRIINANVGGYADNPTHWALYNNYQFQLRRITHKGRFRTLAIGPGLMRSFLPETYRVSSGGEVERIAIPGRFYFAPVLSIGLGKIARVSGKGWQIRLHTFYLIKYNRSVVPQLHLEVGYKFGHRKSIHSSHSKNL